MQVNKIRELGMREYSHIVVTHTDAKELYLWDTKTQPAKPAVRVCPSLDHPSAWAR